MGNELKQIQTISILGGTGKEGKGLAFRWGRAGYKIIIGSRSLEKAEAAVRDIHSYLPETASIEAMLMTFDGRSLEAAALSAP